jgi:pantothenate kinase
MTDCKTNINNNFNNILFKSGILNKHSKTLQKDRKYAFQYICLPIRFIIAIILLYLSDKINIHLQNIISIILILFSIYHLFTKSSTSKLCQWWSNSLEIFFLVITIYLILVGSFYNYKTFKIVSLYMIFSIFIGQSQNLILNPFDS